MSSRMSQLSSTFRDAGTLRHMGSGAQFGSMGNVLRQNIAPLLSRQVRMHLLLALLMANHATSSDYPTQGHRINSDDAACTSIQQDAPVHQCPCAYSPARRCTAQAKRWCPQISKRSARVPCRSPSRPRQCGRRTKCRPASSSCTRRRGTPPAWCPSTGAPRRLHDTLPSCNTAHAWFCVVARPRPRAEHADDPSPRARCLTGAQPMRVLGLPHPADETALAIG